MSCFDTKFSMQARTKSIQFPNLSNYSPSCAEKYVLLSSYHMHIENCPTLLCVNDIWRFRTAGHTTSFSHHFSISHAGVSPPAWGTRTQARSPRIHHCLHAEQIIDLPPTGGSRRLLYPACCRGPPPISVSHFQILEEKK